MSSIKCREQAKRQQDGANCPSGNTEKLGGGGTQNPSMCCLMIGEKQQLCAKAVSAQQRGVLLCFQHFLCGADIIVNRVLL